MSVSVPLSKGGLFCDGGMNASRGCSEQMVGLVFRYWGSVSSISIRPQTGTRIDVKYDTKEHNRTLKLEQCNLT